MCTKNYSDQMFTIIPVTISVMGVSSYRVHEARTLRPWPKEPIYIWVEWESLIQEHNMLAIQWRSKPRPFSPQNNAHALEQLQYNT